MRKRRSFEHLRRDNVFATRIFDFGDEEEDDDEDAAEDQGDGDGDSGDGQHLPWASNV